MDFAQFEKLKSRTRNAERQTEELKVENKKYKDCLIKLQTLKCVSDDWDATWHIKQALQGEEGSVKLLDRTKNPPSCIMELPKEIECGPFRASVMKEVQAHRTIINKIVKALRGE